MQGTDNENRDVDTTDVRTAKAVTRDVHAWRTKLLDGLLWVAATALVVAAIFASFQNLLRWAFTPFLALTVTTVVAAVMRSLGYRSRLVVLIGGIYGACTLSLLVGGVAPNALVGLAALATFTMLLLGRRWGVAFWLLSLFTVGAVCVLTGFGIMHRPDDWYVVFDAANPSTAARFFLVFTAASGVIVFGTVHLVERAEALLLEKAKALEALKQQVTQKEQLQIELERERVAAQRNRELEILGRLAGFVAHDFNNALSVISNSVEYSRDNLSDTRGLAETLDTIDDVTKQAGSTAQQLIAFGRKEPLSSRPLNAAPQLERAGRMIMHILPSNIETDVDIQNEAYIYADEAMLQRTLVNLALNARDAMPKGGTLRLALRAPSSGEITNHLDGRDCFAVIDVADTGVGIDADAQAQLFTPFYTTKGERGTGLGLASVRDIVEQQGGTIKLESAPGEGSTFSLFWPLAK